MRMCRTIRADIPVPSTRSDFHNRSCHVRIFGKKMISERQRELLNYIAEMLLRQGLDCIFYRICCDDTAIIIPVVGGENIPVEKYSDIDFVNLVRTIRKTFDS